MPNKCVFLLKEFISNDFVRFLHLILFKIQYAERKSMKRRCISLSRCWGTPSQAHQMCPLWNFQPCAHICSVNFNNAHVRVLTPWIYSTSWADCVFKTNDVSEKFTQKSDQIGKTHMRKGSHFKGAHFNGAHFNGAHFKGAHFKGTHFRGAHFKSTHAHKSSAHFTHTWLWKEMNT